MKAIQDLQDPGIKVICKANVNYIVNLYIIKSIGLLHVLEFWNATQQLLRYYQLKIISKGNDFNDQSQSS